MIIKNNRSQVTIFIIIALLIVSVIVIFSIPRFREAILPTSVGDFVPKTCIEKAVRENLNLTMAHGGKIKPGLYFMYNNQTINYLCYTLDWYKTCIMQTPFLKQTVEAEVQTSSQQKITNCLTQMEDQLRSRGYDVTTKGTKNAVLEIKPGVISVSFNITMTLKKGDAPAVILPTARFKTEFNSEVYSLIIVSSSILNYEARYGDSYPETFMGFYPNLKIEKKKQDDGTKVYIVADRNTGERLFFATRSLAWPPGYAITPTYG